MFGVFLKIIRILSQKKKPLHFHSVMSFKKRSMTFKIKFLLQTLNSSFEIVFKKKSFTFDCYNLQIHKKKFMVKSFYTIQ